MKRTLRIDILILCLLSIISGRLSGQERLISKAAEEIQAGNFIKAEEQLEEAKKKSGDSPLYSFTKFRFFESDGHSKFNIDSAYFYLLKTDEIIKSLNDKEIAKYCKESQILCNGTISNLKINIPLRAFYIYAKSNSIDSLNIYKSKYTSYASIKLADDKIEILLYQKAKTLNTIQAFESYLSNTKTGFYISEAKEKIREIVYQNALKSNTVNAFKEYITSYPNANNLEDARNMIYKISWEETLKANKAAKYLQYQSDYPDSPYIDEAIKQYKYTAILIPFFKCKDLSYVYEYVDYTLKKPVFEGEFDYAELFGKDNMAIAGTNGKYGVINRAGIWVIDCKYDYLKRGASAGKWVAQLGNYESPKLGVIDNQLNIIIPFIYDDIRLSNRDDDNNSNWYIVSVHNPKEKISKLGVLDKNGKTVIPVSISDENDSDAIKVIADKFIEINGKSSTLVLDHNGKALNTFPKSQNFTNIQEKVSDNLTRLFENIFLDNNGNIIHSFLNYAQIGKFSEGLVLVQDKHSKLYGYADSTGNLTIPAKYIYGHDFSEGLAAVQISRNGERFWSYIDKNGVEKIKTNLKTDKSGYQVTNFRYGYAWATNLSSKTYIIKASGEIESFQFQQSNTNGFIKTNNEEDNKKIGLGKIAILRIPNDGVSEALDIDIEPDMRGLLDLKGNTILKPVYIYIQLIDDTKCWVQDYFHWFVFDYVDAKFLFKGIFHESSPTPKTFRTYSNETDPQSIDLWAIDPTGTIQSNPIYYYINLNYEAYANIEQ